MKSQGRDTCTQAIPAQPRRLRLPSGSFEVPRRSGEGLDLGVREDFPEEMKSYLYVPLTLYVMIILLETKPLR